MSSYQRKMSFQIKLTDYFLLTATFLFVVAVGVYERRYQFHFLSLQHNIENVLRQGPTRSWSTSSSVDVMPLIAGDSDCVKC